MHGICTTKDFDTITQGAKHLKNFGWYGTKQSKIPVKQKKLAMAILPPV